MLVSEDNKVKQVPVKLGERTGDYVQLVEGPAAGSRVLAVGSSFTLDGDGYLQIPDRPGLGVELDPDKVARYCDNAAALFAS